MNNIRGNIGKSKILDGNGNVQMQGSCDIMELLKVYKKFAVKAKELYIVYKFGLAKGYTPLVYVTHILKHYDANN